jgi:hypothetical protein
LNTSDAGVAVPCVLPEFVWVLFTLFPVFQEMYLLHIPMEVLSELFESYKKERMKSQE